MKKYPYPAKIIEWSAAYNTIELLPKNRRIQQILSYKGFSGAFDKILAEWHLTYTTDDLDAKLEQICLFIEDAAMLPEKEPRGARWHSKELEYAEFFTPEEVVCEMKELKSIAGLLQSKLESRSKLILFEKREELQSLLTEFLASPQLNYPFDDEAEKKRHLKKWYRTKEGDRPLIYEDVLPTFGRKAGKNNWRNALLEQLLTIVALRFGRKDALFIHLAVAALEALLKPSTDSEMITESGARELAPMEAHLDDNL